MEVKIGYYGKFCYEEPCISNENGTGAVFFSGCALKCVFCQNYEISTQEKGKTISVERLAEIFKELESQNVYCINLVNPTHYAQQIIEALHIFKPTIPVVWNSHGYESVELIKKIAPYIDIFLPDLKYYNEASAVKYSHAPHYFEIASKAITLMSKLKPLQLENDKMRSGVLVRHLILPLHSDESIKILEWIKSKKLDVLVSVLSQYLPYGKANEYKEINRKITKREHEKVINSFLDLELNGFTQDLSSASGEYIPKWY